MWRKYYTNIVALDRYFRLLRIKCSIRLFGGLQHSISIREGGSGVVASTTLHYSITPLLHYSITPLLGLHIAGDAGPLNPAELVVIAHHTTYV